MAFMPKVALDLTKERGEEVVAFLEQCGRWPRKSLHNTVSLDSEECHEREIHCADADVDALVRSPADARGCEMATKIVSSGMPGMGVMEELNKLYGRLLWRWKDLTTVQVDEMKERHLWFFTWRELSNAPVFQLCWLGRRISIFWEDLACAMRLLGTPVEGTIRRLCGPSRLFSLGQSGVGCSSVLRCRTH